MTRVTPSFFILLCLFVVGCSLYQSAGRKDFEGQQGAPGTVHLSSMASASPLTKSREARHQLLSSIDSHTQCRSVNSIEFWIKNQFSSDTHELVYSGDNLEIWEELNPHPNMPTHLELIAKEQMDFEVCSVTFENDEQTRAFLEEYVKE